MTRKSSNAFSSGGGPDFDLAVIRARDDQVILPGGVMIEGEGRREWETDLEFDASQTSVMALECLEVFPGGNIPHHYLAITTGANDLVALEPDGINWALMALEGSEELKRAPIPDADESVLGTADDMLVVDAKIEDASSVSAEDG